MAEFLPLFPVRMHSDVQSVAKKSNLIPNDEPFIWLVYAPPNSGKSTFVANMILDERWGFSGRHKNLISKEAAKVGDDNPYDPKVLDDPDTDCWPVAELKDAEQVFKDQIMTYEPEDGEQRQLTIIDDYGLNSNTCRDQAYIFLSTPTKHRSTKVKCVFKAHSTSECEF